VELLAARYCRSVPDGNLRGEDWAVYEIVVEGVANMATLARPEENLVYVGAHNL
jgi:hypothetical protein